MWLFHKFNNRQETAGLCHMHENGMEVDSGPDKSSSSKLSHMHFMQYGLSDLFRLEINTLGNTGVRYWSHNQQNITFMNN